VHEIRKFMFKMVVAHTMDGDSLQSKDSVHWVIESLIIVFSWEGNSHGH